MCCSEALEDDNFGEDAASLSISLSMPSVGAPGIGGKRKMVTREVTEGLRAFSTIRMIRLRMAERLFTTMEKSLEVLEGPQQDSSKITGARYTFCAFCGALNFGPNTE